MQAALAGGKAKKKKWNKGKMREKINAKVLFDEDGWNRLQAEVPKVNFNHYLISVPLQIQTPFYMNLTSIIHLCILDEACHPISPSRALED